MFDVYNFSLNILLRQVNIKQSKGQRTLKDMLKKANILYVSIQLGQNIIIQISFPFFKGEGVTNICAVFPSHSTDLFLLRKNEILSLLSIFNYLKDLQQI